MMLGILRFYAEFEKNVFTNILTICHAHQAQSKFLE